MVKSETHTGEAHHNVPSQFNLLSYENTFKMYTECGSRI